MAFRLDSGYTACNPAESGQRLFELFMGRRPMRLLIILLLLIPVAASAAEGIREFPVETIVALGKELYQRDEMAAKATDALLAADTNVKDVPMVGWVTQLDKEHQRVFFIQKKDGKQSLAYVVTFPEKGAPKVENKQGDALPDYAANRLAARDAAIKAIPKFMTEKYNFEVLDAPDGKGLLVYALAATTDPNQIVVGGHYRVSVSDKGAVEKVDALSRSLLILPKQPGDLPKGSTAVAPAVSHIVSKTPVESHVFVSLQHKTPLFVTTEDSVWLVNDGKISKADAKDLGGKK